MKNDLTAKLGFVLVAKYITRNHLTVFLGIVFFALSAINCSAQQSPLKKLSLEAIYKDNVFHAKGIQTVRWMDDNQGYSVLENNPESGGKDIIRYDVNTGQREVLVSAAALVPAGRATPLLIYDYFWSDDNRKLLIFTNTRKVWRLHTRGDYWVLDLENGNLVQLGSTLESSRLMFAKFSPDSKKVGFVYRNNIYCQSLETGQLEQLTMDGNEHIINGTFDWAYEEELKCRDGFRWSPDSKKIAFWQLDTEGTGTFYLVNNIDSIYPKIIPLPYPKVGTPNSSCKIGSLTLDNKKIMWMDIPGDPRDNYLARMDWAHSSEELLIQQLNREQNTNRVYLAHTQTGRSKVIYTEKVETWLEVYDDPEWIENGNEFIWLSDQTGWLHLGRVSKEKGVLTPITSGNFEVIDFLKADQEQEWVYYIASPENATQQYLYRSRLNGEGKPELLSPEGQEGQHSYQISSDCKYAVHHFSNHNTPPLYEVISLPDHQTLSVLEDNRDLQRQLAKYAIPRKEFFKIHTDEGLEFDAWMIKPLRFDPGRKYPVIFYIYGEPASATVQDRWENLWHHFLAQEGYIVISIDNRGTNTPRGRAWRKSVYKKIGIIAPQDQAACARKIMEWDFIDPERIGMWGWSAGGSNTLNCMFRYPGIYKTGIAIAFISDQKLYDNIYQERFMSLPSLNEEGYRDGSPVTHAKNLEGNLLLIYGSADDNCHYQNCQILVDELIRQNKYFTMIDYPMRSHSINERENTTLHLRMTMLNYLKQHLPVGTNE